MVLATAGVGGAYHGQQQLQEEEEKPLFPFGWPAYAAFSAVGCVGMLFLVSSGDPTPHHSLGSTGLCRFSQKRTHAPPPPGRVGGHKKI
jgi:hypothetical protein